MTTSKLSATSPGSSISRKRNDASGPHPLADETQTRLALGTRGARTGQVPVETFETFEIDAMVDGEIKERATRSQRRKPSRPSATENVLTRSRKKIEAMQRISGCRTAGSGDYKRFLNSCGKPLGRRTPGARNHDSGAASRPSEEGQRRRRRCAKEVCEEDQVGRQKPTHA